MFSGIVEEVGSVERVDAMGDGRRFYIAAGFLDDVGPDQSISVDGACQTIVDVTSEGFVVEAVEETLQKTTLERLEVGSSVNLERAIRATDRLDGHLVQGHIDSTGRITESEELSSSWLFDIVFESRFARYLIPTGSITVDGISLTVARLSDPHFTVSIIPRTYEKTTVREWTVGREVNLEFDMVGKYVVRRLELQEQGLSDVEV